jgi:hypothetical protein
VIEDSEATEDEEEEKGKKENKTDLLVHLGLR